MDKRRKQYDNTSISALKGPDRVRLRPGVIFGSDGIEGCSHAMFEILSNSIDEHRAGYGTEITVIRHTDCSITVKDKGRGIPLDFNPRENRYNYELIFEELYAGGKYSNEDYEFSLGLNGLGSCATQYASEYMDVKVQRDDFLYELHFEKGFNIGGLKKTPTHSRQTFTEITFKPDIEVFTDIDIPLEFYRDTIKKQAIVNRGLRFILIDEASDQRFEYLYESGIMDYIEEIAGEDEMMEPVLYMMETKGKDRPDKEEYKFKAEVAFVFTKSTSLVEYYHNSSFLEHGGSPDKAVKAAFVHAVDSQIKYLNKYNKNEKKVSFVDIQESLVLIVNSFSTQTSYENQTKKAVTNRFIQEALTDFIKERLKIFFIENKELAEKALNQILINKHYWLSFVNF